MTTAAEQQVERYQSYPFPPPATTHLVHLERAIELYEPLQCGDEGLRERY